uniref:Septin-type G domain-containing protein n=1 Tax=Mastacembelus armatus TaxID=205130 RepID=A0A3Q3KTV2_9TELE
MSEFSVNDHLEGILSDFEALKKSFDIEDVDDIPSFSSASTTTTPVSPSSSHFFLNHTKGNEGPGRNDQSPSLALNNNNNMGSVAHQSCIRLNSNPSPLKSPTIVSSLSFNRGTMSKPTIYNNGSSVMRAASFQSRLNPSDCSMQSGPCSDNDSLQSSTSSLEYTRRAGGALPFTNLGSYPSPSLKGEYYQTQPWLQQQYLAQGTNLRGTQLLKKFSSHGNVIHSEMDHVSGVMPGVTEAQAVNHGSMPSLNLKICDGGGMVEIQRNRGRLSSGLTYINANGNWNGCLYNGTSFEEDGYNDSQNHHHHQQQVTQLFKAPQSKAKEIPRLNKFPLDLDSLVSSASTTSATKPQGGSMNPNPPKHPPRTGDLQHHSNPKSTSVSPSASLSSLNSSSDTPTFSLHHPLLPFSPNSPTFSQSSIPFPELSSFPLPIYPVCNPQLGILSEPEIIQLPPGSPSRPRAIQSLENGAGDARDNVASILQRIASFTRPVASDTTQAAVTKHPTVQSKGQLLSALHCPAETTSLPLREQGKKKQEETAGELEIDPVTSMEEQEEKKRGIMGQVQEDGGNREEQLVSLHSQNSMTKQEENFVELCAEMEEKEIEQGQKKKEVGLCKPVLDLQMSFIKGTDLFGYVGIEAVLDQMRRKTMKAGFEFNIMVVGQSGLGKSTLVNTLFKSKVSQKSCTPNYEEKISKTVKLHSISHMIEEKGVKMKLTVVDTPGFGDQINNENCWEPIMKYVNEQYEKYLREEMNVHRKRRIPDSRVHCCIYFLPATGHRLRPIDVEFMKRLGKIVSIVPVIAKADTLTIEERQEFKERESIPFAVVGTDKEHQVNGNKVLGRKTKWGIIEVENRAHCEFASLRDLLIRSHLQDLKDVTHSILYETYRVQRLNESNMSFNELGLSWPLENGTAGKSESESHL